MSVKIRPIFPSSAVPEPTVSTSKHVLKHRLQEIRANGSDSFSYSTNQQIVIDVNSPTDFCSFSESYLRFELTCSLTNEGADAPSRYLAEGGAHALFRTLQIETQSGVVIQRIDRSNKLYSVMSSATHSPDYVDNVLFREGDSFKNRVDDYYEVSTPITFASGEANYDHTGDPSGEQLLILSSTADLSNAYAEIKVGDILRLEEATANYTVRVLTIVDANSVTVEGLPAADIAAFTDISKISSYGAPDGSSTGSQVKTVRQDAANTAKFVVCMQPWAPFLHSASWFPLFLLRGGIRITLTLEQPQFVLCGGTGVVGSTSGFAGADCVVKNPTYVCSFIQPDQVVSQQLLDEFRSKGINYNMMGIRHFLELEPGSSAIYSRNLNVNVRSARAVFSKIQNQRAETVTSGTQNSSRNTYTCDSIAQGLRANLKEYIYESGSERFPLSKPMSVEDAQGTEAQIELERTMGHLGVPIHGKRYKAVQWKKEGGYDPVESGNDADSQRFIVSAYLARDRTPWSGLDLSLNPLRMSFDFTSGIYQLKDDDGVSNGVQASRYIHSWVMYDQLLHLSESQGVVIFS